MSPGLWTWRRTWRRVMDPLKARRVKHRATRSGRGRQLTARRSPARRRPQLRCDMCRLFVRALCDKTPDPCGVCPGCCPGHRQPGGER